MNLKIIKIKWNSQKKILINKKNFSLKINNKILFLSLEIQENSKIKIIKIISPATIIILININNKIL
jgi:hypothetical protein